MSSELPELREVDVGGPVRYRMWDGPEGATFVLVHGLGGSHISWLRVAADLSGLGRVVALDLPGFGASPVAGRGTGLMEQRRTLSRFVRAVRTGEVVVCGNSMGGALAVLLAAIDPDAAAGIVLTGSTFPLRWRSPWALPHPLVMAAFLMYAMPGIGEVFVNERTDWVDPERLVRLSFRYVAADPRSIPDEDLHRHAEMLRDRASDPEAAAAFLEAARSIVRLARRPDIAHRAMDAVRCPVLVLHGRRDRLVPVAAAESALAEHPQWRSRVWPDLGHVPQLESPGRWLSAVADWFAGTIR